MSERLTGTVLWIAVGEEGGGVGRSLVAVAETLEGIGLKVRLVTLMHGPLVDLATTFGIDTVVASPSQIAMAVRRRIPPPLLAPASLLLSRPFGWARAVDTSTGRAGWRDVRAIQVRSPALLSLGGLVARRYRVPLVWQIANAPGTERRAHRFVYRRAVRRWRVRPLANSHYVSESYRFLGDIPWAYVPIESSFRMASLRPPPDGPLRFLSLGRVSREKGQAVLVAAFERFLEAGGSGQLRIVGLRDDDANSEALRRQVAASPWRSSIELSRYTIDPKQEFDRCHVLIAGQVGQEPFGQSAAQALALARPVLAVGRGGPAELVEATGFGWHVTDFEVGSIQQGLIRAAQDYEHITAHAAAAATRARMLLHPRVFQKAYLDILRDAEPAPSR